MVSEYLKIQDELFLLRNNNGDEQRDIELTEQLTDIWNKLTIEDQNHIESLPQPFSLDDPRTYLDRVPVTLNENDPMFIKQPQ
jgi:hypothetical protein